MATKASKTSNKGAAQAETTIGAALATLGVTTATTGARKLTDDQKAQAASDRASKVLHAQFTDRQYAIAMEIVTVAKAQKAAAVTWTDKASAIVTTLYTEADKAMLLGKGGAAHIKAVGNALATMAGSTWARRQYRDGIQLFLFGKDSDKKLPGARRVKSLPPKDVARYSIDSYQRIVGYVKRINRKDVEATDLAAITDAMRTIAEGMAVLRKACSR